MFNDLMENIEWFFNLHDKNKDGYLTKDEVLTLSESFLFIFRFEIGDAYLGAVSRFMANSFEYGDALLPQPPPDDPENNISNDDVPASPQLGSNQPYLNLATFRMVVLAEEVLESFFETDLSESFKLHPLPDAELSSANSGLLGDIWSSIASDNNKKMFHLFTDEIGKTIGKHQVLHKPSIGRYTKLEEPRARESLLTPTLRRTMSKASLTESSTTTLTTSASTLTVDTTLETKGLLPTNVPESASLSSMPMIHAMNAAAALMERTPFAIDDAKDDDEDDEDDLGISDNDDQVLDEVDAFLEAHDSGLTDADKKLANDLLHAEPLK